MSTTAPTRRWGRDDQAVKLGPRSAIVLTLASIAGLMMFVWPLLVQVEPQSMQHGPDAPFVFMGILPIVIIVVLAELSEGGMDSKALAMLGVLSAVNAAMRPLGAGTAGIETVFFILVLAGRVYGAGFGFVLGCTSLFASALLTAGVGPWLPFQMLCSAWIGMGAGLLPRQVTGRREIAMLIAYGIAVAYLFGFLMNLWFWPFITDAEVPYHSGHISYVAGAPVLENLHRFAIFTLLTSTAGWDTGRAITNTTAIVVIGPALLATFRRAARKASYGVHPTFERQAQRKGTTLNQPTPVATSGSVTERPVPSTAEPSRHSRRSRPLALFLPVVVLALAACQPKVWPVQVPYLNNADAAAEWLVSDFEERGHLYGAGPLADTILGLAATGADRALADPVLDALEAATPAYTRPGGNVNPGSTAKVLLAVQAARADGNDFAGIDLEADLRSTMVAEGPNAGRFGTSNAFTQPLAMMALARTRDGIPPESAQWLAGVQCPNGAFSWGNCNFADADHTGLATQGLIAAGGHKAAVDAAAAWLTDVQLPDGSFNAGSGAGNANSTGLAVPALRVTGHHAEADAAAQFVQGLQYGPDAGAKAGAIPWTATIDSSLQLGTTQGVLAWGAGPYHLVAFPAVKGEACADEDGVTVIVDLARHDNTIRVSCAVGDQATGWAALESAGFTVGSVPGYEGQAICTINDAPADGYPTCWNDGFWGYFHDEDRTGEWELSNFGAANRTPPPGSVEGWRYEPSWATHWAAAPGANPLHGATCARPLVEVIDLDGQEALSFTGPWGAAVEVATADGSTPFTWEIFLGLDWVETSTIVPEGSEPLRVFARSTDPLCEQVGIYHAVHEPGVPANEALELLPAF